MAGTPISSKGWTRKAAILVSFDWWKNAYAQATGSADVLFWCGRVWADECQLGDVAADHVTDRSHRWAVVLGGMVGWVQFCSKINASQAIIPAIPVVPVAAPAFVASSCEIGGRLIIGPPGGGVYIGVGVAGGSGISIGGN